MISRLSANICLRVFHFDAARVYSTAEITHFVRLGLIDVARNIFDDIPNKSVVAWNAIISGYLKEGKMAEAQDLFDRMPTRNIVSWNGLLSGYISNEMVSEAREVFDNMPERNVVSWTSMVKGYMQVGNVGEAERLFCTMPAKNIISWTVMLQGLIENNRIIEARAFFDRIPVKDVVAWTNMVNGLCSVGRLKEARALFDEMPMRNVVAWTCMINGYAVNGHVDIARKLFEVAPLKNEVTWTCMIMGYSRNGRFEDASRLFDISPTKPVPLCNEMIACYGMMGHVHKARALFNCMSKKDETTWSSMIKVYERKGCEVEALDLFRSMIKNRINLHFPPLISILAVCGSLATIDYGRQIHAQLVRSHFDMDVYITSVLITMYIRCGDFGKGKKIFCRFPSKDVVMWNSIITGLSQHGFGEEALEYFSEMCVGGWDPDEVTFIGVLAACGHAGRVDDGLQMFHRMGNKYSVNPQSEHYACVVDLLGRAGRVEEALRMIQTMKVEADAIVWGALLGACKTHMKLEMAEVAAKKLVELEPENAGPYVLLSNLYASKGRWKDVEKMRVAMGEKSVRKSPGCSWIEADKRVHVFKQGDCAGHPERADILRELQKMNELLRGVGYNPDHNCVFHDVDQEEKLHNLSYHSEKIAVAYGLFKIPKGMVIRVFKNLRVCGDCHSAIKLIANVTGRQILLRDANRFHHFNGGSCSCNDYW